MIPPENAPQCAREQGLFGGNTSAPKVVFYALSSKFVDEKRAQQRLLSKVQEVVYYSLAIGHHLGVIDCLAPRLQCPLDAYLHWIDLLPATGEAHHKLAGIQRFGEITIDASHIHLLALALRAVHPQMNACQQRWTAQLTALLQQIENDPAMYLLVRKM